MTAMRYTPKDEIDARVRTLQQTLDQLGLDGALVVGTPDSTPLIKQLGWQRQLAALGPEGFRIRSVKLGPRVVTDARGLVVDAREPLTAARELRLGVRAVRAPGAVEDDGLVAPLSTSGSGPNQGAAHHRPGEDGDGADNLRVRAAGAVRDEVVERC